jgi:hypothetical protein
MFAALTFRNVFSFPALGIPPQLYATGSAAGTAIQVTAGQATSAGPAGNYANFKKWVFILQTGSGATTTLWNAWIAGGSGSAGSASIMLPASSTSTFSGSGTYGVTTQFGSAGVLVMEIRGEYINGLNSNFSWIKPVMSITGASAYAALLSLAFLGGSEQASLYDFNSTTSAGVTTGFCMQETDAF